MSKKGSSTKRRSRLFLILMLVVIVGLVGYGFTANVIQPGSSASTSAIPEYVGALKLSSQVEGTQAKTEINKLHGTSINLQNAFIARYRAEYGGEQVEVWAGETATHTEAVDLINRMVSGIQKGGSPFTNPRQVTVGGQQVWQTDGAGGQFFFYVSQQSATRVVWLSIQGPNAAPLLESSVKIF